MAESRPVRIETVSRILGGPVEISVFPGPSGLSVYFRDISARKRMEEALRERDNILSLAERSAEIGIWDVDLVTGMVRGTPQFFQVPTQGAGSATSSFWAQGLDVTLRLSF